MEKTRTLPNPTNHFQRFTIVENHFLLMMIYITLFFLNLLLLFGAIALVFLIIHDLYFFILYLFLQSFQSIVE